MYTYVCVYMFNPQIKIHAPSKYTILRNILTLDIYQP